MKQRRTISERLTTKYQLVIRNEENLAEKSTLGFTYAKVLVITATVFVITFVLSLFLSKTLLAKWFDPRHEQMEQNKKLYTLALKVDSLAVEIERKDRFIQNFQRILSGDTSSGFVDPAKEIKGEIKPVSAVGNLSLAASDSLFRKEFERSEFSVPLTNVKNRELQETFFSHRSPVLFPTSTI